MEQTEIKKELRRLPLSDEALMELTRRVARGGRMPGQRNTWAEYMLLLALANKILAEAPQTCEAVEAMDAEEATAQLIATIVNVLHGLLPGGIMEIMSYLSPEKRKKGWGCGVNW